MANILSQDEVEFLLKGITEGKFDIKTYASEKSKSIEVYDFSVPVGPVYLRLPALGIINERFAGLLRTNLQVAGRSVTGVNLVSTESVKFSDFCHSLPTPSSLNIFSIESLRGYSLVVLEGFLVFSFVDSLFGGKGVSHVKLEGRRFTAIEKKIVEKVVKIIVEDFQKAWSDVCEVNAAFIRSEIDPKFVGIGTSDDLVIVNKFEVQLENGNGFIVICIPFSSTEAIKEKLKNKFRCEKMNVDKNWKKYIQEKLIKEATAKVKRALRPDAMILSTQRISKMGENDVFELTTTTGANTISDDSPNMFGKVKQELMSIKEMLYLLNDSDVFIKKLTTYPGLLSLYAKLIKNGVNDRYVRLIFERTGAFNGHPVNNLKIVKNLILKEIMKVIDVKDPFDTKVNDQIIAAFIGTTGVGKTTTIAKLAARLMLEKAMKVGLISLDAYRIGAIEQLKTYANILGVPCLQAFKKKDLLFALRRMEGKDIILIDTAGQSQYDRSRLDELKRLIPDDLDISTHLLLSIATAESEMNKAADNFRCLKYQSYIFTKRDETQKYGSILNQIMKKKLPVSFITTGQNVPEDIEQADKQKILQSIIS